jgi:hypothetical protein
MTMTTTWNFKATELLVDLDEACELEKDEEWGRVFFLTRAIIVGAGMIAEAICDKRYGEPSLAESVSHGRTKCET